MDHALIAEMNGRLNAPEGPGLHGERPVLVFAGVGRHPDLTRLHCIQQGRNDIAGFEDASWAGVKMHDVDPVGAE
jgi:hypothetical protein